MARFEINGQNSHLCHNGGCCTKKKKTLTQDVLPVAIFYLARGSIYFHMLKTDSAPWKNKPQSYDVSHRVNSAECRATSVAQNLSVEVDLILDPCKNLMWKDVMPLTLNHPPWGQRSDWTVTITKRTWKMQLATN